MSELASESFNTGKVPSERQREGHISMASNPLIEPSPLDFGLPPFDLITDAHFLPAFEAGIAEQAAEVGRIAASEQPPTFDNTLVALERSGRLLRRVKDVFDNLISSDTNPERERIRAEIASRLAAHSDSIRLNTGLFERIHQLYQRRDEPALDPESSWLLQRYHLEFQRAGAGLDPDKQRRLRAINEQLATLSTRFDTNMRDDTNALAVVVDDVTQPSGMSEGDLAGAAELAAARGEPGKYVIKLEKPTSQPVLASLDSRALREKVFTASEARGSRGNAFDTTAIVTAIARLRAERAALLGYPNHAAYVIADGMARTVSAAQELLQRLVPPAVAQAQADADELQAVIEADGATFELRPWDWSYYAERVRRDRFEIDNAELRPYFELERVLHDGVFYAAQRLYGISFAERTDLPVYHPDVRVFEVRDADGSTLGLFLADYFTRESKRGGAWMNNFARRSGLLGGHPVVVNNLNVARPPQGRPALLSFKEVTTAFHEFGHALHGLFADITYPRFSGLDDMPRDFVEFPSQVNEMWALWPEVLANYARHYRTGEPLPQHIADRLRAAQRYGEGFASTEYLAAALLDLAWHQLGPGEAVDDVAEFEATALQKAGVAVPAIPPRYHSANFQHIFAGGYSAGYYSYVWSQVLDADTVDWFTENGGLRRENGDKLCREVLAKGAGVDLTAAYRAFRGRDPVVEPLLRRKGFLGS